MLGEVEMIRDQQQNNILPVTIVSRVVALANVMVNLLQPSVALRCIFALIAVAAFNLTYIIWKLIVVAIPTLYELVDLDFLNHQIVICTSIIGIYVICILIIWWFRDHRTLQHWLEFCCLQVIALTMAYQGYIFGSVSIVTGMMLMCLSAVGVVLFSRKALYSAVFTGTALLTITAYAYSYGVLPYAPKFIHADMFISAPDAFFLISNNFLFSAPIFFGGLFAIDFLKTELKKREALFTELLQLDPLTKIYNRHMIYEYMKQPIASIKSQKKSQRDAVILLDMDFFKSINDSYGHQVGDHVLIQAANTLRLNIREQDILARFGGEEFIIILPDTSIAVAYTVAERCRSALAALRLPIADGTVQFTASFGVTISDQRDSLDRYINIADQALYQAKRQGRNCTVVHPSELWS